MSRFVYDPNKPDLLVERYNAEIGDLYKSKANNAWAFLNDEREVLDFYLTDVDGEWVDPSTSPSDDHDGLDLVVDRAREVGATNVICLHNHAPSEPDGPCASLGQFMAMTAQRCDEAGLHFRAGVVTHGGALDGVVYAKKVIANGAVGDALKSQGPEMLDICRAAAASGDPDAIALLPMMEEIVAGILNDELPDLATLEKAIEITARRAAADAAGIQPQPRKSSLLDLPQLNVKPINYLN